ncbi:U3 small nucleolar RNA-associated protein 21 [Cytospora mali]|uniref:U3 small nucleolar RNA-associated protein 21 n=1 Tax=Cytospora mali TaxID=578113 RepID=A0A194V6P0_CYTMA|nr:U3 small nucleolar RNA-associated protein 21 [Valsa mali var. pyri (nom. inval.)]
MDNQDTAVLSTDCQTALCNLVAAVKGPFSPNLVDLRESESFQERFDQWAGNLGAFQAPESPLSLEHRLRNNAQVRDVILKLLVDLLTSTRDATDIVSGRRENRTAAPVIKSETDLAEYGISSSDSDSSSSSSSNDAPLAATTSEIQELMSAIKISLENLFKTSIFIRNFAPRDRRQKAAKTVIFDNLALISSVRLGSANARRRHYFKYCRDHNDRLSKTEAEKDLERARHQALLPAKLADQGSRQEKSIKSDHMRPSILAETEATELLVDNIAQGELSALLEPKPAPSVISYATTIVESTDDSLVFPPLPPDAQTSSSFLCPYCLAIHALFEHELHVHRSNWVCPKCDTTVDSAEALEGHIGQQHTNEILPKQIPMVVGQARRPIVSIQPSECSFCEDTWALTELEDTTADDKTLVVTVDELRRHLGHHLQQIALFSLPRLSQDQEAGSNAVVDGVPDRDILPAGHRWVRDDCGRGWRLIAARRCIFVAFASFQQLLEWQQSMRVTSVAFSPDSRWLASDSDDNTIKVWDPATGRCI